MNDWQWNKEKNSFFKKCIQLYVVFGKKYCTQQQMKNTD